MLTSQQMKLCYLIRAENRPLCIRFRCVKTHGHILAPLVSVSKKGPWRSVTYHPEQQLVGRGGQGPGAPHPPHRERVAESLVRHVAAAGPSPVQLIALQNLAQKVDVPGRQLQRLNLAQLVRR